MRKLFDDIQAQIAAFLAQRDQLTLVACLGAREQIAVGKVLEDLDQGASAHVFWIFTDVFADPVQYANAITASFSERFLALQSALEASGAAPFPSLSERVLDPRHAPAQRLRQLLVFARSLIPSLGHQLLVAAFVPFQIDDADSYADLLGTLLHHDFPRPWCHHMRFIVREDPAKIGSCGKLSSTRTRRYAPDLSDAALERSLEAEVDDAKAPIEQRMQMLLVLAGMDSAHQRTAQALQKYELLANYHCELGNLPALALALNGMGEACAIARRPVEARVHFERALTPSLEARDQSSLTNITFNLARLHQSQREWSLAVDYYQGLSTLARASLNASLQVICHEQRGECLRELGQVELALEEWRAGEALSAAVGLRDERLAILRRSAALLTAQSRSDELRKVELALSELSKQRVQERPS